MESDRAVDSGPVRGHGGVGGQSDEALGRGCGGLGTKIHAVVSPLGHPVVITVTGAQAADGPQLPSLIAGLGTDAVLADKGYDSASNRAAIRSQGPSRASRRGRTGRNRSCTTGTCTESGASWNCSSVGSSNTAAWRPGTTKRAGTTWGSCGWHPLPSCLRDFPTLPHFNQYDLTKTRVSS